MSLSWRDIAFQIEPGVARSAAKAWSWLLPEPWEPLVCSMVGGLFLEQPDGVVQWLDTGTGLVEEVASSRGEFEQITRTSRDRVDEWFLPPLIERLHAAGKVPGPGQCYGFAILPVFAEGKYEVGNMFVIPASEQLVGAADVHRQLSELPDGASVRLKIVD